jgi:hypothetical protein
MKEPFPDAGLTFPEIAKFGRATFQKLNKERNKEF